MYQYYKYSELFKPEEVIDYLRKSRTDDPSLTVEEVLQKHEAMLDEWAEKNIGGKVPEKNKYREVVSGETIADRPEIQKVLKLIESPEYKAIKCYDVQRLSRGDLEDAGRLIKLLRYTNTFVITPLKTYDLRDEYDRDVFERELKRGNEFLEYTKKIMGNGRLLSVSQGNYLGSIPPYGYDKVWVMDGKRKCPTLKENKEQADAVRMAFDLYVNKDMGCNNICKHLDNLGIKPPKGKRWSPNYLRNMLENVHYIGKVKWNHRKKVTKVEDSEIVQSRPKSRYGDYLIYEGRHDAIISEELFEAALKKQGKNHRAKAETKIRNSLASLLFCQCGRAMTLRTYKENGKERSPARLICVNQTYCKTGSCLYDEMIEKVCDILKQYIENFEIQLKNDIGSSAKQQAQQIKRLENKMRELQEKELAQWEAQSHPDPAQRMPAEIFKQLNEKLLSEKEKTEQALRNAHNLISEQIDYEEKILRFKDALEALQNPEVDAQTKNMLLKNCIERIDYSREKPQRMKSQQQRITINGKRTSTSPLHTGANWANFPIKLDVKLKM